MVGDTPADTIMGQSANLGLTIGEYLRSLTTPIYCFNSLILLDQNLYKGFG